MDSRQKGTPLSLDCSFCGNEIRYQENLWEGADGKPYCDECMMRTDCSQCGKSLTLTKKQVAQLEDPICMDCANEGGPTPRSTVNAEIASFSRRVLGAGIDLVGYVFWVVLISAVITYLGFERLLETPSGELSLFGMGIFLFVYLYYFILAEGESGKTFGKRVMKTKVVRTDGSEITVWNAFLRNIVRPVDLIGGYMVGTVGILFSKYDQRLGDYFADTVVVKDE